MNITKQPTAIHTAFNPVIVEAAQGDEDKAVVYLCKGWEDNLPADHIGKSREYLSGSVQFNLKEILKNLFENTVSTENNVITNKKLHQHYSLFNDGGLLFQAMALNAVSQVGVSSDFTTKRGFFLTEFEKVRVFEGYEYQLYALAFDGGTTYVFVDGEVYALTALKHFGVDITAACEWVELSNSETDHYLRSNTGDIIVSNDGEPIEINLVEEGHIQRGLRIVRNDAPGNPFYVRWTNQRGGKDYWMFECRQFLNRTVSDQVFFEPFIADQQDATAFKRPLSVEPFEKIKVSTGQMNRNEADVVSKLIYSPDIEWYSEAVGAWVSVFIKEADLDISTFEAFNDNEITFELPTPQIQF